VNFHFPDLIVSFFIRSVFDFATLTPRYPRDMIVVRFFRWSAISDMTAIWSTLVENARWLLSVLSGQRRSVLELEKAADRDFLVKVRKSFQRIQMGLLIRYRCRAFEFGTDGHWPSEIQIPVAHQHLGDLHDLTTSPLLFGLGGHDGDSFLGDLLEESG
jgi:hypothetical protein